MECAQNRPRLVCSHVKPSKGSVGGLITYGDLDNENCDAEVVYVPLSSLSYWQFPIESVSYGAYKKSKRAEAISDTGERVLSVCKLKILISFAGTSFILGPTDDVQAIVKASGASYDFNSGLYTIPCSKAKTLPPVVIGVKGKELAIPASEHIVDVSQHFQFASTSHTNLQLQLPGGQCALGFDVGFGFSFDWLLGDAFSKMKFHNNPNQT